MNKNIVKLFAVLMMCFALVSVLVACGTEGPQGPAGADGKSPYVGDNGTLWYYDDAAGKYVDSGLKVEGTKGDKGDNGEDLTCGDHAHNWSEEDSYTLVAHAAGVAGVEIIPCVDCGTVTWKEIGHTLVAGEVVAPTCTTAGHTVYNCDCGYTENGNEVAATGHNHEAVVTAPTCTEDGYTTHTCAACGDTYTDSTVNKLGHAPAVEFDAENPDETVWTKSDDIAPDACICTTEPVYTATCAHDNCDEIIQVTGNAPGHHFGDPKPSENTQGVPACKWPRPWIKECTVCSADHLDCGRLVEVSKDDPAPHTEVESITTPATCETDGLKTFTCSTCGDVTRTEVIPALTHNKTTHEAKAPTCTEKGWDAYETCDRCDLNTQVLKDALGHNYTANSEAVLEKPTTEATGTLSFLCDTCGEVAKTVDLPALTEENIGEGKFYTHKTTDAQCKDMDDIYSASINLDDKGTYELTWTEDGDYTHTDAPAESEWRRVEGKENDYLVYKCGNCGMWIVVKHVPKAETPANPAE